MWSFSLLLFWGCCGMLTWVMFPLESMADDVDECLDTTMCPAYATCTNTLDSYYCTCKRGFISSNGLTQFRGPGVTCKDIDECSQSSPPCGPNSVCRNLLGRYKCSCFPGFSSPTGNDWVLGNPGRFSCTDINECLSSGVCPEHTECINSLGSYNCSCQVGFISHNSICEDVDECADPTICPEHATCHNSPGSYSCVCNLGFESSSGNMNIQGSGETCEDVDECARNSTLCGLNSICINTPGKYNCSCLPGFFSPAVWNPGKSEDFGCVDIDECSQSPPACGPNSVCRNLLGRYKCSCFPGFSSPTGNDWVLGNPGRFSCTDIDECSQSPPPCGPNSVCRNLLGRYKCSCFPGFSSPTGNDWVLGNPGRFSCTDIDECSQSPPPCGPNSVCRNLLGRYKCSCFPGFSSPTGNDWVLGNPGRFSCTDINECLSSGVCPEHAECINSLGSYNCSCQVGFISHNSICEDVDECADPTICPEHATCHNSPGSYSCVCNLGFESSSGNMNIQGPGETCEDVDECARNSTLCGLNSICINTPGKYNCSCLPGFFSPAVWNPGKSEDFGCVDIDECSQSPPPCGPNSVCRNLLGRYKCSCFPGFSSPTGNDWVLGNPGRFSCTDINECLSSGVCPEHAECINSLGSYNCSCQVGFISHNSICEDVDECADPTICPEHATCHNSPGSYSCVCNLGFESSSGNMNIQGPGETCEDVDECARNSTLCGLNSICINTPGKYNCSCLPGFFSPAVWNPGKSEDFGCVDIDECSQSPPACGPNSVCRNLLGRYKCSCFPGFSSPTGNDWVLGNPGRFSCTDINECLSSGVCPEHAECINSLGSYNCSCQVGFISHNSICEDVDECADPTICPEHATCHNSPGSYSCVCNLGFESSSGNMNIQGPGETCEDVDECARNSTLCGLNSICINTLGKYNCSCLPGFFSPAVWNPGKSEDFGCVDIDECSQSSPPCGPNSVCRNLLGRYKCSCFPGFSSPTGNDWVLGNPGRFSCTDINECLSSGVCPEHAECINSLGSYNCSCQVGFISHNSICEDVDECADPTICPEHATCHNSPGSYSCVCNLGFESSSGNKNIQGPGETCENIDECAQDSSPCGPNSVCTNALGSYSCSCIGGFQLNPEGSLNFSCKRIPFKCKEDVIPNNEQVQLCQMGAAAEPEYGSFCTLMNATFSVLDDACENKTAAVSLKNAAESVASVLEQTSTWSNFTREETSALATVVLESVRSSTLAALQKPSANASQIIRTQHLEIESKIIKKGCAEENTTFYLKAKGDKMQIACSTIEESTSTGPTGVALVSFSGMESFLDESFFQDPQTPLANSQSKLKVKMNSRIVQGIMTGEKKDGFSNPVIYILENMEPKQKFERPICVSWDTSSAGSRWMSSGCVVVEASETYTVCGCNRMVNLAIIMASGELTMEFSLYLISHVGMIISLVCLVLAIATFLLCRAIRNHNTYLHLHLCICLFLAKTLFIVGVDKTDNQMGCAIIAGFLHYLFLACFFWMLVEAVMLFLMVRNLKVVNYFSSRNIKMWYLCVFGYGLPVVVVAVSASVQPRGYGMHNRCWLNTETGFIWSFLGPVCAIIMINSILLTWTLCVLRQKLSSVNAEVSTLKDTRLLTFKAFAQLFILGCSWVLGIFQMGPMASIMAYLFTITNSLQGAFIFIVHCLLNRQVREEYRRWITRRVKPSSETQSSGMLLSSVPSASKTG